MDESRFPAQASRRSLLKSFLAAAALATGLVACGGGGDDDNDARYYTSWAGALSNAASTLPGFPAPTIQSFENQSVRQVMRLSLGGDDVRVKLSNLYGTAPVTYSGVHIAKSVGGSEIDVGTDRKLTFNGGDAVQLAPGAEVLSDPVTLPALGPLTNVAVTFHFAGRADVPTEHSLGRQTTYIGAGNQLAAQTLTATPAIQRQSYYGISSIETSSTQDTKVVVAFGDSITDGFASTVNATKRYPNQLDDRLKAAGKTRTGVVNEGISGNRWLNEVAGPSGISRFDRDVLGVEGVTHVIILLGINDIGFEAFVPTQAVTAQQIIDAISTAVAKAKAKNIKVLLGTLLPFEGTGNGYYSEAGEAKRQAVNAWIRGNANADAIVDFDAVMRDPANPGAINPAYDSGDHLHPNDAGYAAMAAAIDLSKLD